MEAGGQAGSTLQEIIDHHEIRKMLSTYCHGCDRGDGPRMASVYGEDSWDDHGTYKGSGREYAKNAMDIIRTEGKRGSHLLGQSQINLNGDEAGVETYFFASICQKNPSGMDVVTLLSGRYVDTLIRVSREWKISKRICVRDWSITLDISNDLLSKKSFVQGELSGKDPSYAVLGLIHPGFPET